MRVNAFLRGLLACAGMRASARVSVAAHTLGQHFQKGIFRIGFARWRLLVIRPFSISPAEMAQFGVRGGAHLWATCAKGHYLEKICKVVFVGDKNVLDKSAWSGWHSVRQPWRRQCWQPWRCKSRQRVRPHIVAVVAAHISGSRSCAFRQP